MKLLISMICVIFALTLVSATAQTTRKTPAHPPDAAARAPENSAPAGAADDDVQQLNADLQRLKVLLNQMRNNLAFVQSSQTPLKHQFELEADAWQLIVEQMDRRIQRIQNRGAQEQPAPHSEAPSHN